MPSECSSAHRAQAPLSGAQLQCGCATAQLHPAPTLLPCSISALHSDAALVVLYVGDGGAAGRVCQACPRHHALLRGAVRQPVHQGRHRAHVSLTGGHDGRVLRSHWECGSVWWSRLRRRRHVVSLCFDAACVASFGTSLCGPRFVCCDMPGCCSQVVSSAPSLHLVFDYEA